MSLQVQFFRHESKNWEQYEEIFDTLREPLLILSSDLRVLKANKAFYTFFRLSPLETTQKFIYDLGNGQWDIPALRRLLEGILPKTKTLEDFEISQRFNIIGKRTLLLNARTIDHSNYILLAIEDVTDRLRYQRELERSNKALSMVAAIASHDLREPIRTIKSFLELIEKEIADDKNGRILNYLHFSIESAKRMTSLVDELCARAHLNGNRKHLPVDLNLVLAQTIEILQQIITETDTKISSDDLPVVIGEAPGLAQLFQNIIVNAIKYKSVASPEIRISAKKEDHHWLLSFKDNGIGISKENTKNIFDMFTRIHAEKISGNGIGLYTCKKIVEGHDGEIWVESILGQGSTFYVSLPA